MENSNKIKDKNKVREKILTRVAIIVFVAVLVGSGIYQGFRNIQGDMLVRDSIAAEKISEENATISRESLEESIKPIQTLVERPEMRVKREKISKAFSSVNDVITEGRLKDQQSNAEMLSAAVGRGYTSEQIKGLTESSSGYEEAVEIVRRTVISRDDEELARIQQKVLESDITTLELQTCGDLNSYRLDVSIGSGSVKTYTDAMRMADWWIQELFSSGEEFGLWSSIRIVVNGYNFYQSVGRLNSGLRSIPLDLQAVRNEFTASDGSEFSWGNILFREVAVDTQDSGEFVIRLNEELTKAITEVPEKGSLLLKLSGLDGSEVIMPVDAGIVKTYSYFVPDMKKLSEDNRDSVNEIVSKFSEDTVQDFDLDEKVSEEYGAGIQRLMVVHKYFGSWAGPAKDLIDSLVERRG